jgi:zinc/manganese transport system permease protein
MSLYHLLFEPFVAYGFMRRALLASFALSLGCGPIGVLLVLRRMSLMGDAMSHAILPGAAIAFLFAGLSLTAMSLGGLIAGLVVALAAGAVSRMTKLKEDASLAGFYLTSLALGVLIVSAKGSNVDLLHVLFGSILSVDGAALLLVSAISGVTLLTLALIIRPLIVESFDPAFLRAVGGNGPLYHGIFLTLVVLNLVAGFQSLGSLMAVGLMMLPAAAARFWARDLKGLFVVASAIAFGAGYVGLLASYHLNLAAGPAIILVAGLGYFASIILGPNGGLVRKYFPPPHYHTMPQEHGR